MLITNDPLASSAAVAWGAPVIGNAPGARRYAVVSGAIPVPFLERVSLTRQDGATSSKLMLLDTAAAEIAGWLVSVLPSSIRLVAKQYWLSNGAAPAAFAVWPVFDFTFIVEVSAEFNPGAGPLFNWRNAFGEGGCESWYDLSVLQVATGLIDGVQSAVLRLDANRRGLASGLQLPAVGVPTTSLSADPSASQYGLSGSPRIVVLSDVSGGIRDVVDEGAMGASNECTYLPLAGRGAVTRRTLPWIDSTQGDEYTMFTLTIPLGVGDDVTVYWEHEPNPACVGSLKDVPGLINGIIRAAESHYEVHGVYTKVYDRSFTNGLYVGLLIKVPEPRTQVATDVPGWRYDWRMHCTVGSVREVWGCFTSVDWLVLSETRRTGETIPYRWLSLTLPSNEMDYRYFAACDPETRVRSQTPPVCRTVVTPLSIGAYNPCEFYPARNPALSLDNTAPTTGGGQTNTGGGNVSLLGGILKFFKSLFKAIFNFIKRNWLLIAIFAIAVAVFFPGVLPALWGLLSSGWSTIAGALSAAGSAYVGLFSGLSFWEGAALLAGTAFILAPNETAKTITEAGGALGSAIGATVGGAVGAAASSSGLSGALMLGAGLFAIYMFTGRRGDDRKGKENDNELRDASTAPRAG